MRKHIKIAVILLLLCLPLMFFGFTQSMQITRSMSRGNYFFEKTRNTANLAKIVITFPDNQVITIEQKDGLWHIKEADDYYAAFAKINMLVKLIRNTTIYRSDPLKGTSSDAFVANAITIQSYDSQDNLVDNARIAPKKDNNKFHYATLNDNKFLYQLNGDFALSPLLMDWVQMPLLTIDYNQIKQIKSDNLNVHRRFSAEELKILGTDKPVPEIHNLMNQFWYLSAEDIRHAVHFARDKFNLVKTYEISMLNGVIYKIDIFQNGDDFWININPTREDIISADAVQLLKENAILYNGWFFKINSDIGQAIAGYIL